MVTLLFFFGDACKSCFEKCVSDRMREIVYQIKRNREYVYLAPSPEFVAEECLNLCSSYCSKKVKSSSDAEKLAKNLESIVKKYSSGPVNASKGSYSYSSESVKRTLEYELMNYVRE